jgi:hypothetical protein
VIGWDITRGIGCAIIITGYLKVLAVSVPITHIVFDWLLGVILRFNIT